jgi:chromosomal replication initiation ATPase DnaA
MAAPGIAKLPKNLQTLSDIEFLKKVQKIICDDFGIIPERLAMKSKAEIFSRPRQVVHFFLCIATDFSYAEIGRRIGDVEHGTVIHSKKVINDFIDTDKAWEDKINSFAERLNIKCTSFDRIRKEEIRENVKINKKNSKLRWDSKNFHS